MLPTPQVLSLSPVLLLLLLLLPLVVVVVVLLLPLVLVVRDAVVPSLARNVSSPCHSGSSSCTGVAHIHRGC